MEKIRRILNLDMLFFCLTAYLIIKGYVRKEDSFLTAETGVGYMLGIIGASMMLMLLLYPLRKHVRFMNVLGPIKYWFRAHMILGVAGPVLILYHANFSLGSTNSNVAFISMLVVAGSGLFGRLFYSKIHHGLYGRKLEFSELRTSLNELKSAIGEVAELADVLQRYEQRILRPRSLFASVLFMPWAHFLSRQTAKKAFRYISTIEKNTGKNISLVELRKVTANYIKLVLCVTEFSIYERLFGLWHVFHIPLFVMMIVSGIIHVIVVHVY